MATRNKPTESESPNKMDCWTGNLLLASLAAADRALLEPYGEAVLLKRNEVLFETGEDIVHTFFPCGQSMISFVLAMRDDRLIEVAAIGREGAAGGIVSSGHKPSFARMAVEIGGVALRIETDRIELAKHQSATLRDTFNRYADALLAQTMQSIACNALHTIEERCCRWLLTTQDRVATRDLPVTQEFLAELLGVQRTTVSAAAQALQRRGLIRYRRGHVTIADRAGLEEAACECYAAVEKHFRAVLPNVKPSVPRPPER
jgi:DNA-binding MarR family transcriptional regulator